MRIPTLTVLLAAALHLGACDGDGDGTTAPPKKTPYEWSLDLDLAGDAALVGLKKDTTLLQDHAYKGLISGKVNGYDTTLVGDTLDLLNVEYEDFHMRAPLGADGKFSFDAYELLGDLDGSMTLRVWLKGKMADRPPSPDTLVILLGRELVQEAARP